MVGHKLGEFAPTRLYRGHAGTGKTSMSPDEFDKDAEPADDSDESAPTAPSDDTAVEAAAPRADASRQRELSSRAAQSTPAADATGRGR